MKVLILSCNTGGGHNSAAHAVEEVVKAHGDEAVVPCSGQYLYPAG